MENLSKNGIARLLTRPLQFAVKSSGQKLRRRRNKNFEKIETTEAETYASSSCTGRAKQARKS